VWISRVDSLLRRCNWNDTQGEVWQREKRFRQNEYDIRIGKRVFFCQFLGYSVLLLLLIVWFFLFFLTRFADMLQYRFSFGALFAPNVERDVYENESTRGFKWKNTKKKLRWTKIFKSVAKRDKESRFVLLRERDGLVRGCRYQNCKIKIIMISTQSYVKSNKNCRIR